jgi:hypothetical protein
MAIYRPSRPRWRATAMIGAVCLLIGGGVGWLIARAGDPDPAEAIRSIRASLSEVSGALEIVEIEYGEAVEGGEVVARPEYDGARAAALRARSLWDEVSVSMELLAPQQASEVASEFDRLMAAIDSRADEAEVAEATRTMRNLLREFGGP